VKYYNLPALLALAALGGCATIQVVEKHPPRTGPVPEVGLIDTGSGEVKYSTDGWRWIVGLRRRSALRRIAKICKGLPYKIVDEFTHNDMEVSYSQSELNDNIGHGLEHYNVNPFHHMIFDCVPEKK
jgi:hypothetical protein